MILNFFHRLQAEALLRAQLSCTGAPSPPKTMLDLQRAWTQCCLRGYKACHGPETTLGPTACLGPWLSCQMQSITPGPCHVPCRGSVYSHHTKLLQLSCEARALSNSTKRFAPMLLAAQFALMKRRKEKKEDEKKTKERSRKKKGRKNKRRRTRERRRKESNEWFIGGADKSTVSAYALPPCCLLAVNKAQFSPLLL